MGGGFIASPLQVFHTKQSHKEKTMRKQKQIEVQLDDGSTKQVLIKELSLTQIERLSMEAIGLPSKLQAEETSIPDELKKFFQDQLLPITTNLTFDEVKKMFPSDLEEVLKGIQEVNKSFFTLLVKLDVIEWATQVALTFLHHIMGNLGKAVSGKSAVSSLKEDTLTQPSMDTPTQ
jgi:hypothetical protein